MSPSHATADSADTESSTSDDGTEADSPGSSSASSSSPRWIGPVLALVPGTAAGLWLILTNAANPFGSLRFTLFDDAMVSMSYARTLARGGGLVWFEGAPRVEGITNPLWTLYMALLHAMGLEGSSAAAAVAFTGLAIVLATAWMAGHLSRSLMPHARTAPFLVMCVTSLSFPLLYWSVVGMEVGAFTLCAVAAVQLAVKSSRASVTAGDGPVNDDPEPGDRASGLIPLAVVMSVGCLVRMDFAIVAGTVIAWSGFVARPGRQRRTTIVVLSGAVIATFVAITVARLAYYGELLPNTYTLKMAGVASSERFVRGLLVSLSSVPLVLLAGYFAYVLARGTDETGRKGIVLVSATGLGQVLYGIWIGGDAWESMSSRFIAPAVVFAVILVVTGAEGLVGGRSPSRSVGTLLTAFGVLLVALALLPATGLAVRRVLPSFLLTAAVPLTFVGIAFLVSSYSPKRERTTEPGASATVAPVILVSIGAFLMINAIAIAAFRSGEIRYFATTGQSYAENGTAIREILGGDGVFAVAWAGAQVYYGDLPAIDMLGKSDRVIARSTPKGPFFPGHNKWDYAHSIARSKPDIVADGIVIGKIDPGDSDYAQLFGDPSYELKCLAFPGRQQGGETPIWVRKDSPHVDFDSPRMKECR